MTRSRATLTVLTAVALVAAAVAAGGAWWWWQQREDERELRSAATSLQEAWPAGRLADVAWVPTAGTEPADAHAAVTARLTPADEDAPSAVVLRSVVRDEDDDAAATATYRVTWTLDPAVEGATWSYDVTVPLTRTDGQWQLTWSPSVVHPQLGEGQLLATGRTRASRGDVLGAGDQLVVTSRPVVYVGIQPDRADDPAASARAVASIVGVDGTALAERVRAAKADAFVDVITLRREAYDAVKDELRPVPGAVFREGDLPLAPSSSFARVLLGSVGPATAEIMEQSAGRVAAGDLSGLSGLQRAYDAHLSGTPGLAVTVLADPAVQPPAEPAVEPVTLFELAPVPGKPLRTTLDGAVQQAAEAALATATKPAGLVAVRVGTGEVLAVANGGPNAAGFNRALVGRYPPGSTFKVVTAYGLLGTGLSPADTVDCPPTFTVSGKVFRNAEGEALGSVPFRKDFAQSCNTAFVSLNERLSPAALSGAATALGVGAEPTLGVDAFTGSVPDTGDPVEHAADMIGQGTVLASPLTMAGVSASVAAGSYTPPSLVVDPAPEGSGRAATALDEEATATLRELMRDVVTSGTGTAVRNVPGAPVHGKTGSAEYGGESPPRTHAWFTGFQDDVAFAIVVEDGGFGGRVAAPLAADFLGRLDAG